MYQITLDNLIIATGETPGMAVASLEYKETAPTIVTIDTHESGSQRVTISNPFWVTKKRPCTRSYSDEYTRMEILEDLAQDICRMNGYRMSQVNYL